jgi:hypothetical protein
VLVDLGHWTAGREGERERRLGEGAECMGRDIRDLGKVKEDRVQDISKKKNSDGLVKTVHKWKFKDGLVKTVCIFPDYLVKSVLIYFLRTVFKKKN